MTPDGVLLEPGKVVPERTLKKRIWRVIIAITGTAVVVAGVVTLVLPGPGALFILAGLGILATEYVWAKRVLGFAKSKFSVWNGWMTKQHLLFKLTFGLCSATLAITTMWLFDALDMVGHLLGLSWPWLDSPLPFV